MLEQTMVFKEFSDLPDFYRKFLLDYLPEENEQVIVREQKTAGKEVFLKVKCEKGIFILNQSYFRTMGKYKLRQKLLLQPKTIQNIKILATL